MKNQSRGGGDKVVTLTDVAQRAGVSVATASRALHGSSRRVREDLRDSVLAAARELDYSPNPQAQAMARGHTDALGLIVHDIADPYFSTIAAGVMKAAEKHGLLVSLASTMQSPERELDYLSLLRRHRSRGAIVVGSRVDDARLTQALKAEAASFERSGGRLVFISQPRLDQDTIVVENAAGARDLAKALTGIGYRRFGVLGGPSRLLTARDRVRGFKDGLSKAGVPAPVVVHGEFTRDGGYVAMAELLRDDLQLDCVFAVNDVMAVGAMAACRVHGLSLPEDIALAGFDDIATLRDVHPSLTTVQLPLEDLGRAAVELVDQPGADQPRIQRVKGNVVLRGSTPGLSH